jgi:HprK-related kinase A
MLIKDIPKERIGRDLSSSGIVLNTGVFNTSVTLRLHELVDEFCRVYADYPVEPQPCLIDHAVVVSPPSFFRRHVWPQAIAYVDGSAPFEPLPRRLAYPMLESSLNWCFLTGLLSYLVLHAAVVERAGRGLLLPAPSGSGKSTLCAALVSRGWRLFSDELAVIRPEDGKLIPNPRPISLKNESIALVAGLPGETDIGRPYEGTVKGTVAFMRPPASAVAQAGRPAWPGLAVSPHFKAGAPAEIELMEKAEAFKWLVDNAVNYFPMLRIGFDTMADLVERVDTYRLTYSSLDDAIDLIEELSVRPGSKTSAVRV